MLYKYFLKLHNVNNLRSVYGKFNADWLVCPEDIDTYTIYNNDLYIVIRRGEPILNIIHIRSGSSCFLTF